MKFLFSIILLFVGSEIIAQGVDCNKFRNGRFIYPEPQLKGKVSWRKGDVQESYSDGNLQMLWKVKWKSDCEYELICTKVLVANNPLQEGDKIFVIINSTEQSCYSYTSILYKKGSKEGIEIKGQLCLEE